MIKVVFIILCFISTFVYTQAIEEFKCNGTIFYCFVSPCLADSMSARGKCAKVLNATCVDNYCNGCNAVYYLNGKEVCQKAGTVKCRPCAIRCSNGLEIDTDTGCNICKCKCPPRICPALYCPNGYELDSNGCETCICKKVCPPVCLIFCPYGNVLDENGCPICKCKPCPDKVCQKCNTTNTCNISCTNGYIIDENGCPTCKCKSRCPPVCLIYCQYGNVLDENGCPTCKCKQRCPILYCLRYCPNGYKTNEFGCPTCECYCPLLRCLVPKCSIGKTNIDKNGCSTCGCIPICPQVKCTIYCRYGYVLDKNGCQTCKCKSRPNICPAIYCQPKCPYGQLMINNCPTCRCNQCPPVLCARYCENGFAINPITGCYSCQCNDKKICSENDQLFKAICPLRCTSYQQDSNGCPTCTCVTPPPKCNCTRPKNYIRKRCYDGTYSNLTSKCVRLQNGKCSLLEEKCPLCFQIRSSLKLSESDIKMLIDIFFRQQYSIPEKDAKVYGPTRTSTGYYTYVICLSYDVFPTTMTSQQYFSMQVKAFRSLQSLSSNDFILEKEDSLNSSALYLIISASIMFLLILA